MADGTTTTGTTSTTTTTPADTTTTPADTSTATPAATTETPPAIVFEGTPPANAEVGIAYAFTPTLSGGKGTLKVALKDGVIPAGITLDSTTGALKGTPTAIANDTVTLEATDDASQSKTLVVNIAPAPKLSFDTVADKTVAVGGSASFSVTATGGVTPITYSLTGDTLPAGVTYDSASNSFAGSPTELKTSKLTLTATDALGAIATTQFSLIASDSLSLSVSPDAFYLTGRSFTITADAQNGGPKKTFALTGNDLPSGTTIDPTTGVIRGTGTKAGIISAQVSVTDGVTTKYQPLVLQFVDPLTISAPTGMEVGYPTSQTLTFSGGLGLKQTSITQGSLPDGLRLDFGQTGLTLAGTPTSAVNLDVTVTTTDTSGTYTFPLRALINTALTLDLSDAPTSSVQNSQYNYTPKVSGGISPITVTYSGTLPKGISFNADTGTFSGVPSLTGTYPVNVTAQDGLGISQTKELDFHITNALVVTYPAVNGIESTDLDPVTPTSSGGLGTKTFAVATNSPNQMPSGLTLDKNTGVISGSPLLYGRFEVWVSVTDSSGSVTAPVIIRVVEPLTLTGVAPVGVVGSTYTFIPSVSGGDSTKYQFSLVGMPLPDGLELDEKSGEITGTPTSEAPMDVIIIQVTDGTQSAVVQLFLTLIYPLTAPEQQNWYAVYKQNSSFQVVSHGGGDNLSYTLIAGGLPDGTKLDPQTGIISGIPDVSTDSLAFIKIVGATNAVTVQISWSVAPKITMSGTIPTVKLNELFTWRPTYDGGFPTKSFSLQEVTPLPKGLTFSPQTGTLSGVATELKSSQVIITITDGTSTATRDYLLTVINTNSSPITIPVANQDDYIGQECTNYVAQRSMPIMSESRYVDAFKTMGLITTALYSYPTTAALDYLWAIHVKYKNSFFSESEFFRGCEGVTSTDLSKIATLYTAFRACTFTPQLPFPFAYLDTQTGSSTISTYLKAKKAQALAGG